MSPLGTVLFGPILLIIKTAALLYVAVRFFSINIIGPNRTVPNGLISTYNCFAKGPAGSGNRADDAMSPGRGLRERRHHTRALLPAR